MARVIALVRTVRPDPLLAPLPAPLQALRMLIVCGCAVALIFAGA